MENNHLSPKGCNSLKRKIGVITALMESLMISDDSRSNTKIDSEIIQQLQDKFDSTAVKIQILTILPKDGPIKRI